jgi:DNA polymerase-3 subunit alpha
VLTYQTAYLKTHYPAEFMAALMTTEMDNTDKITKYIADARAHGLPVLAPDVNASQKRFSVERVSPPAGATGAAALGRAIRFGLEAIKGVGGIAVDTILEARQAGPFPGVMDFCRRVSTRKVNKKVLESLTMAGAFDGIAEVNRASLFASLEGLLDSAGDEQEERELGQSSLFDSFSAEDVKLVTPQSAVFKSEPEWPRARLLALEKQVVGFYVTGHPLDTWQKICEDWLGWSTEKIKAKYEEKNAQKQPAANPRDGAEAASRSDLSTTRGEPARKAGSYNDFVPYKMRPPKPEVKLGGLLSEMREVMTKKGTRMAFAQIEDLKGRVEVVFFPDAYAGLQETIKRALVEAEPVLLTGELEIGDEAPKVLVKTVEWLAEAHRNQNLSVVVRLDPSKITPDQLREMKKSFLQHRGKCPVRIEFTDPAFRTRLVLPKTAGVAATPQMVEAVNKIFGGAVVQLQ